METWAWLLAYVVGFGLLQLVLYHHFRGSDARAESAAGAAEGGGQTAVDGATGERLDGPVLYCQHCGVRNDHFSTVRYCHNCVSPLR